jgi:hypothetical protein
MKITLSVITLLLYSFIVSNSYEELTKEEAKSLITNCIIKYPIIKTKTVTYGIVQKSDLIKKKFPDFLKPYEENQKLGVVSIGKEERVKDFLTTVSKYEVTLTEKGKELLIKTKEVYKDFNKAELKVCEYKVTSIEEIMEVPAYNIAKVKVKLTRINETILYQENNQEKFPNEYVKLFTLKKTTDGWKACN